MASAGKMTEIDTRTTSLLFGESKMRKCITAVGFIVLGAVILMVYLKYTEQLNLKLFRPKLRSIVSPSLTQKPNNYPYREQSSYLSPLQKQSSYNYKYPFRKQISNNYPMGKQRSYNAQTQSSNNVPLVKKTAYNSLFQKQISNHSPIRKRISDKSPIVKQRSDKSPIVKQRSDKSPIVKQRSHKSPIVKQKSHKSPIVKQRSEKSPIVKQRSDKSPSQKQNTNNSPILKQHPNEQVPNIFKNERYVTRIDYTWLSQNPVYNQFRIKELKRKKRVTVLVIVSTAPRRVERRNAIRETWWKQCKPTATVIPECIFVTDNLSPNDRLHEVTRKENLKYGDMYFQNVPSGVTFGKRLLNHMLLAVKHYKFDYFLRVDDDYFFCFRNFLNELPIPMVKRFHWGWVHNEEDDIVRPEESMLLLSRDLIETFLLQDPKKILCHPFGDQMIGLWSNTIDLNSVYRHDNRLHHHPPVESVPSLRDVTNVCHTYIGIHGTYPKDMRLFWKNRGKYKKVKGNLITHTYIQRIIEPFRWDKFEAPWRHEPKLCIDNHVWNTGHLVDAHGSYGGREEESPDFNK